MATRRYCTRLVKGTAAYTSDFTNPVIDPSVFNEGEVLAEGSALSTSTPEGLQFIVFPIFGDGTATYYSMLLPLADTGDGPDIGPVTRFTSYPVNRLATSPHGTLDGNEKKWSGALVCGRGYLMMLDSRWVLSSSGLGFQPGYDTSQNNLFAYSTGGVTVLYLNRMMAYSPRVHERYMVNGALYSEGDVQKIGLGTSDSPYRVGAAIRVPSPPYQHVVSVTRDYSPNVYAVVDVLIDTITYYRNYNQTDTQTIGTQDVVCNYDGSEKYVSPSVSVPVRAGYSFTGWATSVDGSPIVGDSIPVTVHDVALYAQWEGNQYTVSFDKQGGSDGADSVTATFGDSMPTVAVPTRTGYEFNGYFSAANGGGKRYYNANGTSADTWDVDSDSTLYAAWNPISYTIHFEGPGTESLPQTTFSCVYDTPVTLLEIAPQDAPTGYSTPVVWDNGSGRRYASGETVSNLTAHNGAVVTLTATWTANNYSVTYQGNGATSGSMQSTAFSYGETKALRANTFRRANHVFKGWAISETGPVAYADQQSVSNLTSVNGGTVALYAVWSATYTIAFNASGGTGTMPPQSFEVGVTQSISKNLFAYEGMAFSGWAESASGPVVYSDQSSVTNISTVAGSTVTLYAKWISSFTIQFDANGGTGTAIPAQEGGATASGSLSENTFTRTGYSASEIDAHTMWNTEPDGTGTPFTAGNSLNSMSSASSTLTLYAMWTANTYVVQFNPNAPSGEAISGSMGDQTFTYDAPKRLSWNAYHLDGYTFVGWNTSANGSGVGYDDGATVSNLSAGDGATVALYAQWTPRAILIRFDANGGSGTMGDYVLTYKDANAIIPVNTFVPPYRWTTAADSRMWDSTTDQAGGVVVPAGGMPEDPDEFNRFFTEIFSACQEDVFVVYAVWDRLKVGITFRPNFSGSGQVPEMQYIGYDEPTALAPNTFTYNNHSFVGWNEDSAASTAQYKDRQVVTLFPETAFDLMDLYAIWQLWYLTVKYIDTGDTSIPDVEVRYESGSITLPMPTKTGYDFTTWILKGQEKAAGSEIQYATLWEGVEGSGQTVYVYGMWAPHTYGIIYNANLPSGEQPEPIADERVFLYGSLYVLSKNTFSCEGWTFDGWNTSANGSGVSYTDMAYFKNLTSADGETVNLYATWRKSSDVPQYPEYEIPVADGAAETTYTGEQETDEQPSGVEVTLARSPNQVFSKTYGGISYEIHLRSFRNVMYADVSVDGTVVSLGVRCIPGMWLIPNHAVAPIDAGNFRFETDGGAYPYYTDFGTTCRLMFFTQSEIEEMGA